jgi:dolichol-phosphate mannosyltransferase
MNSHFEPSSGYGRPHTLDRIKRMVAEALKFSMVGVSGVVLNLAAFKIFVLAGGPAIIAPIPSFLVAVTSNYFLNSHYTFKSEPKYYIDAKRYVAYLVGNLAGLAIDLAIYYPLYFDGRISPFVAQALGVLAASVFNFFAARRIIRWRRKM